MTQAQHELVVIRPFRFAHEGVRVEEFAPDAQQKPVSMTARCAEVAIREGWARRPLPAPGPVAPLPAAPAPDDVRGGPNQDQGDGPLDSQAAPPPSQTESGLPSGGSGQEQPSSASHQGRRSRRSR